MLLSLLWDEIVADDMKMFSVRVMKLLIWKVLLKWNSKSYHVVKEKRIIYDAILKTRHERNSKIFFFFLNMSRVNEKRVGEMVENVMWKFQKLNFVSSFYQYSNSCEQYFDGEEFEVGTFLSTVPIQKNSWIDQIWTKFATGWKMVFFPMYYLQKQSQQFKERTRCWPCFGHSFLLSSLLRSHLRLWLATRMISAHCVPWTPFLQEHDLTSFSQ